MKEELKVALATRYPTLKPYQLVRCVNKYVAEVINELALQISGGNVDEEGIDFASDQVRARCDRTVIDKKQRYVLTVMHEHPSTALVLVVYEGNNITHEVSKVIFNPRYKKDVLEALQQESLIQELNPTHLDNLEGKANWDIPVDVEALRNYINATRASLAKPGQGKSYSETLTANLLMANALLSRVRVIAGKDVLSEYWEESDCGRMYGHGLSLQRVPRHVRNAALGPCHKYDFKSCSYALMTSLALQIDPTLKVAAIKDYIKYRSAIRKRIADKLGVSKEWMKDIFTAIGFGAKTSDNPFSYVRGKLGSEKYNLLMANDEFIYIKLQFDTVTEAIAKAFPNEDFEFFGCTYTCIDPKRGTKRSKAQKLAWIYQCMESVALQRFVDLSPETPLLAAHDCLYFKNKLPLSLEIDIRYKLNQEFSLLHFEHEEVKPIGFVDSSLDVAVAAHKRFIAEQEQEAKGWTPAADSIVSMSPTMVPTTAVETDEQYETRRRNQFLLDVARSEQANNDEQQQDGYFSEPYFKGKE